MQAIQAMHTCNIVTEVDVEWHTHHAIMYMVLLSVVSLDSLMQVSSLPWPYTSREHFEKSHCTPIGRHWNSELTFHQLVRPKVTTKMGTIIEPIRLTEDVQDFMKRTEKKSRPQKGRKKKSL